jgi:membrane protein
LTQPRFWRTTRLRNRAIPGSLLATLLWIGSSFGFKFYVTNFGSYHATYGAIGGVIVILLWFSVSAFAILIGAEVNGVIEQAERH